MRAAKYPESAINENWLAKLFPERGVSSNPADIFYSETTPEVRSMRGSKRNVQERVS